MRISNQIKQFFYNVGKTLRIFPEEVSKERDTSLTTKVPCVKGNPPCSQIISRKQFKKCQRKEKAVEHLVERTSQLKGLKYEHRTTKDAIFSAGIIKNAYLDPEKQFTSLDETKRDSHSKTLLGIVIPSIEDLNSHVPKETLFHLSAAIFSKPGTLTPRDKLFIERTQEILSLQKPFLIAEEEDNIHELALHFQYKALLDSIEEMQKKSFLSQGNRIKKLMGILENVTSSYVYGRIPGKLLKEEEYFALLKMFMHLFALIREDPNLKYLIGSDAYTKLLLSKEYLDQASPS